MRLDQALVQLGLVPSRTKAQDLIRAGFVEVRESAGWKQILSPSENVSRWNLPEDSTAVRILEQEILKYVSRGGLKLESALLHLEIKVRDQTCLDCGQSTGGFTDCLLQAGARKVVGFDVGHGQLALSLKSDARIVAIEGLHIKDSPQDPRLQKERPALGFDLVVADLSFVSLEKVFSVFPHFGRHLLALVKPQFEVGAENLNKKGIVRDLTLYAEVETKIRTLVAQSGGETLDYFPSGVEGRDGNQEFFVYVDFQKEAE